MEITTEAVKALREATGAGIMDCKRALLEAEGDAAKARVILRERGVEAFERKRDREANQGLIEAYVHGGGRIASLLELNCETDFVARNDEFKRLARELAMQVAAMNPQFVSKEEVPQELIEREQLSPQDVAALALLSQPYIRDQSRTVDELVREVAAKTGEHVRVRRFSRFELGK